jgi:hypothetical protein
MCSSATRVSYFTVACIQRILTLNSLWIARMEKDVIGGLTTAEVESEAV